MNRRGFIKTVLGVLAAKFLGPFLPNPTLPLLGFPLDGEIVLSRALSDEIIHGMFSEEGKGRIISRTRFPNLPVVDTLTITWETDIETGAESNFEYHWENE